VNIPSAALVLVLTLIVGALLALSGAVAVIFRLLRMDNERQVLDITADRNSYRQIAEEAMRQLDRARNQVREARGQAPFTTLAAVQAEHSSPVTAQQVETAHIATLRARLMASILDIQDVPPKQEVPPPPPPPLKALP
jgi:hypothetical protein